MLSQPVATTSAQQHSSAVRHRHKEGFLSGNLLSLNQASSGAAALAVSVGASPTPMGEGRLVPSSRQENVNGGVEVSLATEVQSRAALEARSVFVYGFVESDWILSQTTQLLRMLAEKCGPITGAFRFFKRAPLGYDRGEYASVVFLVVFDTVEATAVALRLTMERVGETLINVQPASSKHKSHAAAQRILESFLPVDKRSELREVKGKRRRWTPDDFSPSNRLWVVILWGNSTYTVNWRAARSAAQRNDAIIIDDAEVMLPYSDPRLIAAGRNTPGGNGYWDVELYRDETSRYQQGGSNEGGSDNPFSSAASVSSSWRSSSQTSQQRYVERRNSEGDRASTMPGRTVGDGGGGGFRSAQQRYYDEKYGRLDYSWDPSKDQYGIRGDMWRLARYGAHCARWALHKTRGLFDGMAVSEQPLRIGGGDGGDNGAGASRPRRDNADYCDTSATKLASPFREHAGETKERRGDTGELHRSSRSQRSAAPEGAEPKTTTAEGRRLEDEENEWVRQGGLRRRHGGVELRRPNPVESSLVWMPGVEYVRPVMNFLGLWKHDEGRRRRDAAGEFDEEDRRLMLDERDSRLVRFRTEDATTGGGDRRVFAPSSAGSSATSLGGAVWPATSARHRSSADELEGGEGVYPALATRPEPSTLTDLSRLTDANIDVSVPARPATSRLLPTASSSARRGTTPHTGGSSAGRKRSRHQSLIGDVARHATQATAHVVSRLIGGSNDCSSRAGWLGGRCSHTSESKLDDSNATKMFTEADFGPMAPPDVNSYRDTRSALEVAYPDEYERLRQSGTLPGYLQNRHDAIEQQRQGIYGTSTLTPPPLSDGQPLRSSFKRNVSINTTANTDVSAESMPLKRPKIRVLNVRQPPSNSVDISAISSIGFADSSIAESAPRRTVNFTLPASDK